MVYKRCYKCLGYFRKANEWKGTVVRFVRADEHKRVDCDSKDSQNSVNCIKFN